MRSAACIACSAVILIQALSVSAADPPTKDKPDSPIFVVCAADEDAEFGSSLFRALLGKNKLARFDRASSIEQAIASKADVLVLVLPRRELPKLEKETLESLKKRKIIGIGYGAAHLFRQLGLEINAGTCAHFGKSPPMLTIGKSELLRESKNTAQLQVLQDVADTVPDTEKFDIFAVFLPLGGEKLSNVDVIARWANDVNYAPIVRQGNCIFLGIPTPATQWTTAYTDLISGTCFALHERPLEPYTKVHHNLTKPGTYEFKLDRRGSIDAAFEKTFYFQFTDPKRLSAQLDHVGSNAVMLNFTGPDEDLTRWIREDANRGETLKFVMNIDHDDISKMGDRYWTLGVTNFGDNVTADCKLTITIEEP